MTQAHLLENTLWYESQYRDFYASPPMEYVSIRITRAHEFWPVVRDQVLKDCIWYISYPHFGKGGNNEHFHIFTGGDKSAAKKIRERCRALDITGNKQLSIKCMQNGVLSAISYAAREGTSPSFRGHHCKHWIGLAPEWQNANLRENLNPDTGTKRKREDEEGIRVTQRNFLRLAFEYRAANHLHSDDICDIFIHMFAHGHYLCPTFARQGMPTFYKDLFKDSCLKGRLCWSGTKFIWSNVVFRDSKY